VRLSNLLGRAIPGWAADRKLSVLGAYRLWEDAYRGGDRRIPVTELSCSNQDRLRRVSTQLRNRQVDRVALEARYRAPARAAIFEPDGQRPDSPRRLHLCDPQGRIRCSYVWP
jgi:hypothetical protein